MNGVALGAVLLGVFLAIVAAMLWQEARRRGYDGAPVYVVEDAVRFMYERLDPETRDRLRLADVRRIVEWEVHYLQGLADRRRQVETFAGGAEAAVDWITARIAEEHGVSYAPDDVRRVLHLEAEYLESIGALGEPVEDADRPAELGGDEE